MVGNKSRVLLRRMAGVSEWIVGLFSERGTATREAGGGESGARWLFGFKSAVMGDRQPGKVDNQAGSGVELNGVESLFHHLLGITVMTLVKLLIHLVPQFPNLKKTKGSSFLTG